MKPLAAAALALCIAAPVVAQTPPQRLFYSGHSLLDQPLPRDVAAIAASLGTPLQWNRQHLEGSSIRERTAGIGPGAETWQGYRSGSNREGAGMDVLAEWRAPRTVHGGAYDTLIVTEQHTLIGNLVWNGSVRHLRHIHERFVEANPRGQTWFYASWLNLDNKDDPRRWIAYERAASPIWQCMAMRVNASLAAEGRSDRIAFLPAGALLVALVERAMRGGVEGLNAGTPRATLEHLFRDDVHLTPLGSYFMALVVYAFLFDRSPSGAAVPDDLDATAARTLQPLAWELVQHERIQRDTPSLETCRSRLQHFVPGYAAYVRDAIDRPRLGAWRAWWQWGKHRLQWQWALRSGAPTHPLRFDVGNDKAYWLPPPP